MDDLRTILLFVGIVGIGAWSIYSILHENRAQEDGNGRKRAPGSRSMSRACQRQTTTTTGCTMIGISKRGVTVKPARTDSPSRNASHRQCFDVPQEPKVPR